MPNLIPSELQTLREMAEHLHPATLIVRTGTLLDMISKIEALEKERGQARPHQGHQPTASAPGPLTPPHQSTSGRR